MEQELRTGGGGGGNLRAHSSACLSGALIDGPRIQQLLLHCAAALESNDVTLAQQAMWVLNNIASSQGDPSQRLTSWLLRALVARACRLCAPPGSTTQSQSAAARTPAPRERAMSVTELAEYVDLMPWHRFGFTASNGAILRAVVGSAAVHVVDLSVTRCMQWPTLIDMLSKRPGGPPELRITVPSARPAVPPQLGVSDAEIGLRLANFAKSKGVQLEFSVVEGVTSPPPEKQAAALCQDLASVLSDRQALGLRDGEALVVNCQSWIRHVAPGSRDAFLGAVRALNPCLVTVTERMRRNGFVSVAFDEEAAGEVRRLLSEHATGWGMKREEDMLVLTWKGHGAVYTSAWMPN